MNSITQDSIHRREREMDIKEIERFLASGNIQYEVIQQDKPILSVLDAEGYYPVEKSVPTFVLQTENGLIGCMVSFQNGRLDFDKLKQVFGFSKLKMADRKKIKSQTGYDVGAIPLVGLHLPCIFDRKLLQHDFVYGGTGNELFTLKIDPSELLKANEIIGMFD